MAVTEHYVFVEDVKNVIEQLNDLITLNLSVPYNTSKNKKPTKAKNKKKQKIKGNKKNKKYKKKQTGKPIQILKLLTYLFVVF